MISVQGNQTRLPGRTDAERKNHAGNKTERILTAHSTQAARGRWHGGPVLGTDARGNRAAGQHLARSAMGTFAILAFSGLAVRGAGRNIPAGLVVCQNVCRGQGLPRCTATRSRGWRGGIDRQRLGTGPVLSRAGCVIAGRANRRSGPDSRAAGYTAGRNGPGLARGFVTAGARRPACSAPSPR